MSIKSDLIAYAHSLGFERVGVTSAGALEREEAFFKKWIAEGNAGEMDYLERSPHLRSRPGELLPGAKSVIVLAMSYPAEFPQPSLDEGEEEAKCPAPISGIGGPSRQTPDKPSFGRAGTGQNSSEGRISRYAVGRDYHKVLSKRLQSFVRYMEALSPGTGWRTFVDTGPLLERPFAQRAGLGFIGKNTMLITKGLGSWVFLAGVVSTLDLPIDSPDDRSCGTCRLCIDACPTQAITEPFKLDARRCIAYLTIESEKSISVDLRPKMGGWIFGCDICQEVCPHNKGGTPTTKDAFFSPFGPSRTFTGAHARVGLAEILSIRDETEFLNLFEGTPLTRAGREGLLRNGCIAAANLGRRDLIPQLECLAGQTLDNAVRDHAVWALEQLR